MAVLEDKMTNSESILTKETSLQARERVRPSDREIETTAEVMAVGSGFEAAAGGAALVLAILGLAGALPAYMAPIAAIALGAAFLFEGGAIAARYHRLLNEIRAGRSGHAELEGGMSAEFLGGANGVVLGILGLLGLDPLILIPCAVIVFGGSLLLGSGATARMNDIVIQRAGRSPVVQYVARESVLGAAGADVMVGMGAVVLGILALVGMTPMTLTLVGLLALGGSVLLTGSAISGRMLSIFGH